MILTGAALLALAACNKSGTVTEEMPDELRFKVVSGAMTKGAELTGISMPKTYGIYAAATQKNASGIMENPSFFSGTEQLFATTADDPAGVNTSAAAADTRQWHASPASIYWPIGGVKMDFLAYALPREDHNAIAANAAAAPDWTAFWNAAKTDAASALSFNGVDTYANQVDVLYAVANGQTSAASGGPSHATPMSFNHAQALLIFNVKVNDAAVSGKITLREIAFYTEARVKALRDYQVAKAADPSAAAPVALADADVTLETVGTFTVDNSRNGLSAAWSGLSAKAANAVLKNYELQDTDSDGIDDAVATGAKVSPSNVAAVVTADLKAAYGLPVTYNAAYAQLGETLLIPEQAKENFTLTYEIGGNTYYYTFNELRGVWEKGKKYIYNLDLALNEIVITETVADFVESGSTVNLN